MNSETRSALRISTTQVNKPNRISLFFGETLELPRSLLVAMTFIQAMWFGLIWWTGAIPQGTNIVIHVVYTVVCGIVVLSMPESTIRRVRRTKDYLLKHPRFLVMSMSAAVLCIGVIYAYYQRVWTWDEENSFLAARILAEEGLQPFFDHYAQNEWLGRFHPPLAPMLYGGSMALFGTSLFVMRLVAVLLTLGTSICTYLIGRHLYDTEMGMIAVLLLITFPMMIRQGSAAMTDIGVTFFTTLAMLLTLYIYQKSSFTYAIWLGLAIGAGLITKYTTVFIGPALLIYYLLYTGFRQRTVAWLIAGAISFAILGGWLWYAYTAGILNGQSQSIVSEFHPGYFITDAQGNQWLLESLLTKLPSAIGLYNIPLLLIGFIGLIRSRGFAAQFILIWIIVFAVELLVTIPDHRYFMPIFPAMAVMGAYALKQTPKATERILLLSLLFGGGSLTLFVNWFRAAGLFNECLNGFC